MSVGNRWLIQFALLVSTLSMGAYAATTGTFADDSGRAPAGGPITITVKPSMTDPAISAFDYPHHVLYDPAAKNGKLLVFLTGTTETPNAGPQDFFRTALAQGYRVINLTYISYPAVSQICVGQLLRKDPDCAAHFRQKRLYGDTAFTAIPDQPQDSIVHRLTRLLQYLDRTDRSGGWSRYLANGAPAWQRIAVAGQSQGGGMAEYLGKRENLARVLAFSGGWDASSPTTPASWYASTSATPLDRWYYAYHVKEPAADKLARIAEVLRIPADHLFANDAPISESVLKNGKMPGHTSSLKETVYEPVWIKMLGSGNEGH